MRNPLISAVLVSGLCVPIGARHAQGTNTIAATCKDGKTFSGTTKRAACRGHGSVRS